MLRRIVRKMAVKNVGQDHGRRPVAWSALGSIRIAIGEEGTCSVDCRRTTSIQLWRHTDDNGVSIHGRLIYE